MEGLDFEIELILKKLSEGVTIEELIEAYPYLTREDIWNILESEDSALKGKVGVSPLPSLEERYLLQHWVGRAFLRRSRARSSA
jgi:Protein of unknown function (DUF433)